MRLAAIPGKATPAGALLAVLAALLVLAGPARATTYNVSTTPQLMSALDAANSNPGLDTIVMAPGTYVTGADLEIRDDLIVVGAIRIQVDFIQADAQETGLH